MATYVRADDDLQRLTSSKVHLALHANVRDHLNGNDHDPVRHLCEIDYG